MQAGGLVDHSVSKDGVSTHGALRRFVEIPEKHPVLFFLILTVVYSLLVAADVGRYLWFDELNTVYIADQPTIGQMFDAIRSIDFNPPLIYILVRTSHKLAGTSEFATRLPSILAFWAACG